VGLYLAPLVILFIGWLFSFSWQKIYDHTIQKIIIILTIITSLLGIYAARSEGALIGIAAGLLIFGLLAGKKQRIATLILLLAVIAGTFWFAPANNFVITKLTLHDLSDRFVNNNGKKL